MDSETTDATAADPSRRTLLAALAAGSLALAAPPPAEGNQKKPKRKANPPQASAVAAVNAVALEDNGLYSFALGILAKDLRPGATADADFGIVALVEPAAAERMREVLVATVRPQVASALGVPAARVSVLIV
jgi:hypothetical protein